MEVYFGSFAILDQVCSCIGFALLKNVLLSLEAVSRNMHERAPQCNLRSGSDGLFSNLRKCIAYSENDISKMSVFC
eukprot:4242172-Amphidinium_carterae.1